MTQDELLQGIVIPVDKPRQWTSFQAVNKIKATIRRVYGLKKFKIGHAGTLDPLATGLLLVCVGKATKRIDELQSVTKVYTGTMVLGATTPCYDLERPVESYSPFAHITPTLLQSVLPQFLGTVQQVPPIFSAIKINGQRAYQYARQSDTDQPAPLPTPKPVQIYDFEITAFRPGNPDAEPLPLQQPAGADARRLYDNPLGAVPPHLPQIDFRIRCGKGTYIRSIARDLGLALDSGAFLSALRREQVGEYHIADALSLDDVESFLKS